jgi:hypothetical protein
MPASLVSGGAGSGLVHTVTACRISDPTRPIRPIQARMSPVLVSGPRSSRRPPRAGARGAGSVWLGARRREPHHGQTARDRHLALPRRHALAVLDPCPAGENVWRHPRPDPPSRVRSGPRPPPPPAAVGPPPEDLLAQRIAHQHDLWPSRAATMGAGGGGAARCRGPWARGPVGPWARGPKEHQGSLQIRRDAGTAAQTQGICR